MNNPVINTILNRKSVRAYEPKDIPAEMKQHIIEATLRAPTAGNMMLYSIIEINDQQKKQTLAQSCDNQPFIAEAPWVLLYLADMQRWYDYYRLCNVEQWCTELGKTFQTPSEADLLLASCDAVIAAHTTVLAAESYGIGSCYIGDIMERYELHRDLFNLPDYVFPITLLCLGYPTQAQRQRKMTSRFDLKFILFSDSYRRFDKDDFAQMYDISKQHIPVEEKTTEPSSPRNYGQLNYKRKIDADFKHEMKRSVTEALRRWCKKQ